MNRKLYSITEFANKSAVSARTLRYYDKKGLLVPSHFSRTGYRLYTDKDLMRLQYILALKFLGFSLDEIKLLTQIGPIRFQDVLAQQKMMMIEKKSQINTIIGAIEETEKLIQANQYDYNSIVKVIQAVQMGQKPHWINKYLTPEQSEYMRELAKRSYSNETLQKIAERGWTEEDQISHIERYTYFRSELKRLAEQGTDPSSPEAQEVGKLLYDMNNNFSKGDSNITRGMKKSWDYFNSISDDRKPLIYKISDEEREFIKKVMIIFYRNRELNK